MRPNLNSLMQLAQQQAMRDPKLRNALTMIQGKSPQELQTMAMNMCRERQTTPEQVLKDLGVLLTQPGAYGPM